MNTATPRSSFSGGTRYQRPLLFYGSPHENGFTRRLLEQVYPCLPLDAEPEVISAYKLQIHPCTDCRTCYSSECPLNGDGMGELLEKFQQADLLICALPIYFNGLPAPMKAIVDRSQQLFVKRFIQREPAASPPRPGILLTTAGSPDRMGNEGGSLMKGAYTTPIASVSGGVREIIRMFYGCLGVSLVGHIAVSGTDQSPEIAIDPAQVQAMVQRLRDWKKD